jgi:hypothetical protein
MTGMADDSQSAYSAQAENPQSNASLRTWVAGLTLAGTVLMFGVLGYFTYVSNDPAKQWMRTIVTEHPAATIGLPICAVIASCIVLLLNATSGPIEFEIPGVKLKGGSGPAVIWVITFLAISYAMKMLWKP